MTSRPPLGSPLMACTAGSISAASATAALANVTFTVCAAASSTPQYCPVRPVNCRELEALNMPVLLVGGEKVQRATDKYSP